MAKPPQKHPRTGSNRLRAKPHSKARERLKAAAKRYFRAQSPMTDGWASPGASPAHKAARAALTESQLTWQGALCYSPMGQCRLIWGFLSPEAANHAWVRFHFIQASILSAVFLFLYAIVGGLALGSILFQFPPVSYIIPLTQALLALFAIHLLLSLYLSISALYGGNPGLPLLGEHAAMLALHGGPLDECKLL